MLHIRRAIALAIALVLTLSVSLTAFASSYDSRDVEKAVEKESKTSTGLVDIELSSGNGISASDWALLKDNGVSFQLHYVRSYYRFRPADVSRTLSVDKLDLSTTQAPDGLIQAICQKTGLDKDEFMIVLPSMLGKLPSTATIGICLDPDFIKENGYTGLNIYGVDFLRTTSYSVDYDTSSSSDLSSESDDSSSSEKIITNTNFTIRAIGLAASGKSADKSWSPWLSISTNVSRLMLITKKSISTVGSMSWNQSSGSLQKTSYVLTNVVQANVESDENNTPATTTASNAALAGGSAASDANPNTGATALQAVLLCGITALCAATIVTLARTFRPKKPRD